MKIFIFLLYDIVDPTPNWYRPGGTEFILSDNFSDPPLH